ncbi:Os10g0567700 [Oryza sativa Japonica Group]|uniref:Uncharacterized protein n=3 Tax=Oryza sativa TaxID=4530 RepID=A0A8J8XXW5_ORYSJ|nr:hypothetical protein [Oryza sativa Japonica Group]EAY79572.1 hypothetical protein OsI_34706 [Oryza sativa Indica Group]AAP55076.1 hypothetical protein LOC_Os10g41810 [Oryza sativa Japonica Group]EAZ17024.1 hypothetical protein OsJ_32512 [Oryza sativa Japonica Group]KAF2914892.1 hypothetical protein DAI22_10g197500 [Oryza sativa Japonica Group]
MSRQARKEAAAAAQDMLKLDVAWMRKPAALQSRKDAAAPMRKAQGGRSSGGVDGAGAEQFRVGGACARAPEFGIWHG